MTDDPVSDFRSIFISIDWSGTTSKPIFQAAYATESRERELKRWQETHPKGFAPIAVISPEEAASLWESLDDFDVVVRSGQTPYRIKGNGWVVRVTLGRADYYVDLGASEETARVFAAMRDRLAADHRGPIDRVMDSLRARKRSRPISKQDAVHVE